MALPRAGRGWELVHQVDGKRIVRAALRGRAGWLVLVALVLTGLPQGLVAWSDGSVYETRESFRAVRRALLLDKTLTGRTAVAPAPVTPANAAPVPLHATPAAVLAPQRALREATPRPQRWLRAVVRILYRHGSNYT